jgi:serine/threonine protein kinase/tetratricopeptide (TPR) repeat protein
MECPEENVIVDFVRGQLGRDDRSRLEAHIDACEACAEVVAQMAMIFEDGPEPPAEPSLDSDRVEVTLSSTTEGAFSPVRTGAGRRPSRESTPLLPQGHKLGRYVVIDRIGSGGMGVVYAAYDPELDRKIALKVLRHGSRGSAKDRQEQRTRLLREAQAMAKLSQPNVITVHDVGTVDGQVFLAMEFIDGKTLGAWMKKRRGWREVSPVFRRAAQGLAAAHAAGLVHRDFKPDNVLLGRDGRVLVTDFGLARPAAGKTGTFATLPSLSSEQVLTASLTQTGALVGTPAYMAPEQLAGERTDPLSDQFSFCVALYEALYGERPFPGRSLAELMNSVSEGRVRPVPRDVSVPRWVRRVLLRGMAVEPEQRFASMSDLLTALRADPWAKWRRVATIAVPASLLAIGMFAYRQSATPDSTYCDHVEQKLQGVWDEPRREEVQRAFAASDRGFSQETFDIVAGAMDRYASHWVEMQSDACRDQLAGEQPQAILALRMTCLARRRANLETLTDVLAAADAATVEGAVDAVRSLPNLDACADLDALTLRASSNPTDLSDETLAPLERKLAEAKLLRAAGKYDDVLALAQDAVADAQKLGHRALEAEGLMLVAESHDLLGHPAEAEPAYHSALSAALAAGHPEVMARVSIGLVWLTGVPERRLEEAERWATHGLAAAEQLGGDPDIVSQLHHALGVARLNHDHFDAAEESLREAIALRSAADGANAPSLGGAIGSLGQLYARRGDKDEAIVQFERARALVEAEYGPEHPNSATALDNLGNAFAEADRYEEALTFHERALLVRQRSLGSNHPLVAVSHQNLAISLRYLGRGQEAVEHARLAMDLFARAGGRESVDYASAASTLSRAEQVNGDEDAAIEHAREALDVGLALFGERHSTVADYRERYAEVLARNERYADATAEMRSVLRLRESLQGADHRATGRSARLMCELLLRTEGTAAEAVTLGERAVRIASRSDHASLPWAQFALARALWADSASTDPDRVQTLLGQIRTALASRADAKRASVLELAHDVDEWERDRPPLVQPAAPD